MIYLTHMLLALMLYLALLIIGIPIRPSILDYTLLLLGAVLPDIDHGRSFISRRNTATRMGSRLIRCFTGHRGFLHTPTAAILSTIALGVMIHSSMGYLDLGAIFAFFLGYTSHILADSIKYIPTGSERERVFFYFSLLTVAMLFMAYYKI